MPGVWLFSGTLLPTVPGSPLVPDFSGTPTDSCIWNFGYTYRQPAWDASPLVPDLRVHLPTAMLGMLAR